MTKDELIEASIFQLCKDRSNYSLDLMLRKNGYEFTNEQFAIVEQKLLDIKVIERDSMVPGRPNFKLSDNAIELGICELGWKKYLEKKEMESQRKFVHQEIKGNIFHGSTVIQSGDSSSKMDATIAIENPKKEIKKKISVLSILKVIGIVIGIIAGCATLYSFFHTGNP